MKLVLFFLCLTLNAFAQHAEQPLKESSEDLRSGVVIFSVEDASEESIYWLERTAGLDFFLRMKDDDKETLRKIDSRDAKKLDMEFASRFLKVQYEIEAEKGDCKTVYRLTMKGESQEICKKDDKKTQEIKPFLQDLKKRF